MKRKYRIGDVLYYKWNLFVITGVIGTGRSSVCWYYRINSTGLSMWISDNEIYDEGKPIEI